MKKKMRDRNAEIDLGNGKALAQLIIEQYSKAPSLAARINIFRSMHSLYFMTLDMMINDFAKYSTSDDIFHNSSPKDLAKLKAPIAINAALAEPQAVITDAVKDVMAMNARDGKTVAQAVAAKKKTTVRKNLAEVNGVAPKEILEGFWYNPKDRENTKNLPKVEAAPRAFKGKVDFIDLLTRAQKRAREQHFKGSSKCRICGELNGSTQFVLDVKGGKRLEWPSGFMHYVQKHNVRPTENFVNALRTGFPQFSHAIIATRE